MTDNGKWTITSPGGAVFHVDVDQFHWVRDVIEVAESDLPDGPVRREYTGRSTLTLHILHAPQVGR